LSEDLERTDAVRTFITAITGALLPRAPRRSTYIAPRFAVLRAHR